MKKLISLILLALIASCDTALAKSYAWRIIRVIDGDTVEVEIPSLPKELKLSVRALGIDTPEKGSRAKCKREAELAQISFEFTTHLIGDSGREAIFSNIKWDKFGGRILADVEIGGASLGRELIAAGLAREYHGEKKKSWCD